MEDLNYLFTNTLNESLFNDVLNGKVNLFESILDPVQKTRCREIFNEDDIMHPRVKNEIKNRFYLWYKQLDTDKKIFDIIGFKMIGSSSGFQYTDTSDIDIQVIIKMHSSHEFLETKKLISILPNNNNLNGTLHPINYYFVDEKDPTKLEYVENLYNLDTKEWEKKADKLNMTIPLDYIREISRFFTDGFDLAIGRYDRDKQYLIDAFKLNPEKQEISEKEKIEVIEKRLTQFQADIDSLRLCVKLAHGLNADAYSDKTPFKIAINYNSDDPRYSVQNIIYKGLDKFDYIGKMVSRFKEGNQIIDKYKNKMKNLTESYDELFSDIINEGTDELFDDSVKELNEKIHWDTTLTKFFDLNKDITLYHYSDNKFNVLKPMGINAGNKLSRSPRKSIWFTEHFDEWCLPMQAYLKSNYREFWGKEFYWGLTKWKNDKPFEDGTLKHGLLITHKFYEEHKKEIDTFKTYRYKKTFKIKELGRGTEPTVPEWTYDSEVIPDEIDVKNGKDLINNKTIILCDEKDIIEDKEYRESFLKKYKTDMVFPYMTNYNVEWWKYTPEKYKQIRKDAEEKFGVKSYRDLHKKQLTESDDIFSDAIKEKELAAEKEKLSDIINILKDIQYGFISKKDGSRIVDRDWIHSCRNLNDYYDVQTDPEETLKNKLGICTDQCILIKYLINKYHPEIKTQMYGMTMGPFGHCLISLDDGGKLYHLENAWNLEQGLHGSFDSENELKEYFESLYHKHHDKDTDAPIFVRTYEDYLAEKENLNESENFVRNEICFLQ